MTTYEDVRQLLIDSGAIGGVSHGFDIHDVTYNHGRLTANIYDSVQHQVIPLMLDPSMYSSIREKLGITSPTLRGIVSSIIPWVNTYTTAVMGGIIVMYSDTFFIAANK